jgi:LTXXQ motif family protein
MPGKLRIVLIVATAAALSAAAYGAEQHGGSKGGSHGSSHGSSGHSGGGHESHASHGGKGDSHGGKGDSHGGKGDSHGHHEARGKDGKVHKGFAGAFRNPLFWLYWPFAYYADPEELTLSCGEDISDIAGLPIDQYHQALEPTEALGAALDDLALAVTKATQDIKIACPSEMPLTSPGRIAALQRRVEAMIAAVELVQPALDKFYGLLTDEQKAKVNAIGQAPPPDKDAESPLEDCGPSMLSGMELPAAVIDKAVHLTDDQRKSLVGLQNADTQAAADLLKASCGADNPITPPARLAAVRKRLDAMLAAVKMVAAALNDFYAMLSDEQKARFEAIGPVLATEEVPEAKAAAPVVRRIGPPPLGAVIRRVLPF